MSNSNKTVCRACLGSNSRMFDLRNTPLQEIFEKITGAELISGGRSAVCYLCTAQLQSCNRFQDMVRRADCESKRVLPMDNKCPGLSSLGVTGCSTTNVDWLSLPEQAASPASSHPAAALPVKTEPVDVEEQEVEEKLDRCNLLHADADPADQSLCRFLGRSM